MCAAEIPSNLCRFRGQTRPSRDFCGTAALSLKPDIGWRGWHVRKVPEADMGLSFCFRQRLGEFVGAVDDELRRRAEHAVLQGENSDRPADHRQRDW